MNHFVTLTYDLENGTSAHYTALIEWLRRNGFVNSVPGTSATVTLPNTTWRGQSMLNAYQLRDTIWSFCISARIPLKRLAVTQGEMAASAA